MEHADEKRVLLCLLEVSRYAREVHIKPPDVISQETEETMEGGELREAEMITPGPAMEDDKLPANHDIPLSVEANADDLSQPSEPAHKPPPTPNGSVGSQAAVLEENRRNHSPLLDYCSYPFLFSFLLLLLLLGGGIYLRRK